MLDEVILWLDAPGFVGDKVPCQSEKIFPCPGHGQGKIGQIDEYCLKVSLIHLDPNMIGSPPGKYNLWSTAD
jgi:hypothetical protein